MWATVVERQNAPSISKAAVSLFPTFTLTQGLDGTPTSISQAFCSVETLSILSSLHLPIIEREVTGNRTEVVWEQTNRFQKKRIDKILKKMVVNDSDMKLYQILNMAFSI